MSLAEAIVELKLRSPAPERLDDVGPESELARHEKDPDHRLGRSEELPVLAVQQPSRHDVIAGHDQQPDEEASPVEHDLERGCRGDRRARHPAYSSLPSPAGLRVSASLRSSFMATPASRVFPRPDADGTLRAPGRLTIPHPMTGRIKRRKIDVRNPPRLCIT